MQTQDLSYPNTDGHRIPQKIPDCSFQKACFFPSEYLERNSR